MTDYVLVPGGWHGGWWFTPIVEQLRRHGHRAYALTPTGLGDRSHLRGADINLDTHIEDLCALIDFEQLTDVVLCSHSYGGMIVTGAADRIAERIAAVVHIDAQVPNDGESLWSLTTEQFRTSFIDTASEDGYSVAPPPGLDERTRPHPLACFVQPIRLAGASNTIKDKHFVWLSEWPDSPTKLIYDRLKHDNDWTVEAWPIGHVRPAQTRQRLDRRSLAHRPRRRRSSCRPTDQAPAQLRPPTAP